MTVKELRDVLTAFDDDAPVLVSGYESYYDDPAKVRLVVVHDTGEQTKAEEWWTGRYRDGSYDLRGETFTAVVIPR